MREHLMHWAINAFIVVNVFWMVFWDAPAGNAFKKNWIPKLQPVFLWLGISGEWRMFSPDPPMRTLWPMAKLTMKNGDVVHWEPTHFERLSVWEKAKYKKFHKYYYEVTRPNSGFQLKRDFVEYLLRKRLHPEPCVKIELYLVCHVTPPFDDPSREVALLKQKVYTFHPTLEEA